MSKVNLNFGVALRECRKRAGMSQEELALESELDRTYISMLERNVKTPTLTTLKKIADALKIAPTILVSFAEQGEKIENLEYLKKKDKMRFPFMGTALSCGMPINEDYKVEDEMALEDFVVKNAKKTFFAKASGDSMFPTISDGDLLVIEISSKAKNGDIVLAQVDGEFTVKRLIRNSKEFKLIPDNHLFSEITNFSGATVSICGIVVGLVRNI